MSSKFIFDGLEYDPYDTVIETADMDVFGIDCGRIHDRIISEATEKQSESKPHHSKAKRRRFVPMLVAAAAAAGIIALSSFAVIGQDNFDINSPEAQAAKAEIETEYKELYRQYRNDLLSEGVTVENQDGIYGTPGAGTYLGEMIEKENYQREVSNQAFVGARNILLTDILDILSREGWIFGSFKAEDVYKRDDEFITACCNTYKYGFLDIKEKTKLYLYLDGRLNGANPFTDEQNFGVANCSESSGDLIRKTLHIKSAAEQYTLEQLIRWGGYSVDRKTEDQIWAMADTIVKNHFEGGREFIVQQYYREKSPEWQVLSIYWNHLGLASRDEAERLYDDYENQGIILKNRNAEGEERMQNRLLAAEKYALQTYIESFDMLPLLRKTDPALAEVYDPERLLSDVGYQIDLYNQIADSLVANQPDLTITERAMMEGFLDGIYNHVTRYRCTRGAGEDSFRDIEMARRLSGKYLAITQEFYTHAFTREELESFIDEQGGNICIFRKSDILEIFGFTKIETKE